MRTLADAQEELQIWLERLPEGRRAPYLARIAGVAALLGPVREAEQAPDAVAALGYIIDHCHAHEKLREWCLKALIAQPGAEADTSPGMMPCVLRMLTEFRTTRLLLVAAALKALTVAAKYCLLRKEDHAAIKELVVQIVTEASVPDAGHADPYIRSVVGQAGRLLSVLGAGKEAVSGELLCAVFTNYQQYDTVIEGWLVYCVWTGVGRSDAFTAALPGVEAALRGIQHRHRAPCSERLRVVKALKELRDELKTRCRLVETRAEAASDGAPPLKRVAL